MLTIGPVWACSRLEVSGTVIIITRPPSCAHTHMWNTQLPLTTGLLHPSTYILLTSDCDDVVAMRMVIHSVSVSLKAGGGVPLMSTMSSLRFPPKNSATPNFSLWDFRTSQMKKSQLASMSHNKPSSRRRLFEIVCTTRKCACDEWIGAQSGWNGVVWSSH